MMMAESIQEIIAEKVIGEAPEGSKSYYRRAKYFYRIRILWKRALKDILYIAIGIFSAGFGLKGFLLPNRFIDGGATGISLLLTDITPLSLSVLLVLVNLPFILLGYKQISKLFALRTVIAIVGLAIVVAVINYPVVTQDKLLVAVFGGFFLGAG